MYFSLSLSWVHYLRQMKQQIWKYYPMWTSIFMSLYDYAIIQLRDFLIRDEIVIIHIS